MTLQEQCLALVRAGLWADVAGLTPAIAPDAKLDWQGVWQMAQRQAVVPLMYEGIMRLPEAQRPQGTDKQPWFVATLQVEVANKRMLQRMHSLWCEYERADVRGVLLKGASLGHFYANANRRMCGDIDVLFPHEGDAAKADAHMQTLGIVPVFDVMYYKHSEFHWHEYAVEHHYYLQEFQSKGYRQYVDGLVREALNGRSERLCLSEGFEVEVLPLDFNLFFQLLHITSHLVQSGIGLRQFCDVARFIHVHQGQFDSVSLDAWIAHLGMKPAVSAIAMILIDWLGVSPTAIPFAYAMDEPLIPYVKQDVWRGGNFGKRYREDTLYRSKRWGYLSWLWASNKRIWLYRRIFPREVWANYTYRIQRVFTRIIKQKNSSICTL